jgi:hypothetical protein
VLPGTNTGIASSGFAASSSFLTTSRPSSALLLATLFHAAATRELPQPPRPPRRVSPNWLAPTTSPLQGLLPSSLGFVPRRPSRA